MSTELDFWPVSGADMLRIIKLYPDHWADINALFASNEDFRLLCQEYGLATEALYRLDGSSGPETIRRRDEYREIVSALESDIKKYIRGQS